MQPPPPLYPKQKSLFSFPGIKIEFETVILPRKLSLECMAHLYSNIEVLNEWRIFKSWLFDLTKVLLSMSKILKLLLSFTTWALQYLNRLIIVDYV